MIVLAGHRACPPVRDEITQTRPKWWTEQQEMYQQGYFDRLEPLQSHGGVFTRLNNVSRTYFEV